MEEYNSKRERQFFVIAVILIALVLAFKIYSDYRINLINK